jgi:glycosyltransferase involved in cell wall biosynthesis
MKVAIITTTLTPYRLPLFEAINRGVPDLRVFMLMHHSKEGREWDISDKDFHFKTDYFPGLHIPRRGSPFPITINYGVIKRLRQYNPDIVISGGGYTLANISAFIYSKLNRKKFVGWGEFTFEDGARNSWVKRLIRKVLTKYSDGSIASSSDSKDVFVHYGAKPGQVLVSVMPVNIELFQNVTKSFQATEEYQQRKNEYPGAVLITIGRLTDSKGFVELFNIYERIIASRPDTTLLIAGNGPQQQAYKKLVQDKGWDKVVFLGFLQTAELAQYVALSDIFIFPTLVDPFGAVLPEAMAAYLPAISSIHAYATRDLIVEGENGFKIDPRNSVEATEKILRVLNLTQEEKQKMGIRANEKASQFTCEKSASEIVLYLSRLMQPDVMPAMNDAG